MISDNAYNFNKHSNSDVDSLGTPYDYYSMMQYDETSFSMNGNVTMVARNKTIIQLGNEVGFTKIDSTQAMLLYKCKGTRFYQMLMFRTFEATHKKQQLGISYPFVCAVYVCIRRSQYYV